MSDRELRRSQLGLGLQEEADFVTVPDEGRVVETAPSKEPSTPAEWVKVNLFSSWLNGALTVVTTVFIAVVLYQILGFVFGEAEWAVIPANMKGYMVGGFPLEEVWRIWLSAYLVALLAGLSLGASRWRFSLTRRRVVRAVVVTVIALTILFLTVTTWQVRLLALGLVAAVAVMAATGRAAGARLKKPLIIAWIASFPVIIVVVRAFGGVSADDWGGFFFNIIAATVGIFASFPLGLLLALGRRSELRAIRVFSVGFIELFRGVPLVGWLIFSKFVVDLLLPPQLNVPDIIKAFLAMTLFSAAYIGEIVRGGLQGVQRGQYEAARAVGLSTTRMMALIVLPQALRSTIPAMISHFISLFKDTALFTAIQVTDLLAAAFRSSTSLEFSGTDREVLIFAALMFWAVAFSMSRWSQRLELRLGVGER